MTGNIVSAVSRYLTPDVVGRIATASGLLDSSTAQKAVNAAVPAILSGLASVAGKPGGAQQIADAIAEQPHDVGTIISNLTSSPHMAANGTNLLSSLLGGSVSSMLVPTLSRFLGIAEGPVRTVVGFLTPVIMGTLGREKRASGLSSEGFASLLAEQKDGIAAAMPSGLAGLLGMRSPAQSTGPVSPSERHTYEAPRAGFNPPPTESLQRAATTDGRSWMYWALPLLALGAVLWALLPSSQETREPIQTSQPAAPPARVQTVKPIYFTRAPADWVSIGSAPNNYVGNDVYNRTGEKLGTIEDVLVGPDGKMAAAVVNVGRFLGIGERGIALPFSALQVEMRDNSRRIVIDITKEALQAAPAFEKRQTPDRK